MHAAVHVNCCVPVPDLGQRSGFGILGYPVPVCIIARRGTGQWARSQRISSHPLLPDRTALVTRASWLDDCDFTSQRKTVALPCCLPVRYHEDRSVRPGPYSNRTSKMRWAETPTVCLPALVIFPVKPKSRIKQGRATPGNFVSPSRSRGPSPLLSPSPQPFDPPTQNIPRSVNPQ